MVLVFLIKISMLGIFSSIFTFSKLNFRVLSVLVSLEAMMLSLLVLFYSSLVFSGVEVHFFLAFMTLAACEAAMGLGLLVSLLRLRSNDYIPTFSTLNF